MLKRFLTAVAGVAAKSEKLDPRRVLAAPRPVSPIVAVGGQRDVVPVLRRALRKRPPGTRQRSAVAAVVVAVARARTVKVLRAKLDLPGPIVPAESRPPGTEAAVGVLPPAPR